MIKVLDIIRIKNQKLETGKIQFIPALWKIDILLHKQATRAKHIEPKCTHARVYTHAHVYHQLSRFNQ
jgi:hypothetical protein